jgi:chemotaxis response regulator CheB
MARSKTPKSAAPKGRNVRTRRARAAKPSTKRAADAEPTLPAVNPVADDRLTPDESLPFPIVAIGASAGGLEAFTSLLNALPADTGMAFVVIQHLSPTHESMLPDILTRATAMPVAQVGRDMPVEANRVYVIAPGKDLVFSQGLLRLAERTESRTC